MTDSTQRSRGACQNCRERKRKCDETRPQCKACLKRKVSCHGYDIALKWNAGIASRGRFTGAEAPVDSAIPSRPRGRARDLKRKGRQTLLRAQHVPSGEKAVTSSLFTAGSNGNDAGLSGLNEYQPDASYSPRATPTDGSPIGNEASRFQQCVFAPWSCGASSVKS